MRQLRVKGVLLINESEYLIHGSSSETAAEIFKSMTGGEVPLWNFDPATEAVHCVEMEVSVPELESHTIAPVNAPVAE